MSRVLDRFLRYVSMDTTSAEGATVYPSTSEQLTFGEMLAEECRALGLTEVEQDKNGYVTATLPANANDYPVIGLIAHMDTSPAASGKNIRPRITQNYDGSDIVLEDLTISPKEFPFLNKCLGQDIVTASGDTLLGADDKAGIAEILTAVEELLSHPEIPHGKLRLAFTPDEEVGMGTAYFDVEAFGADFGYTMDGDEIGQLQYENFCAAKAEIQITGKSVHPGTAKGLMINAALAGAALVHALPQEETPATTAGYQGFFHVVSIEGDVSSCHASIILRDFNPAGIQDKKDRLMALVRNVAAKTGAKFQVEMTDQYRNMREVVEKYPVVLDLAKRALTQTGVNPIIVPIRGGTDGANLSFLGLPCPNLGTGGQNFHGPYELIPVQAMEKAVELLLNLARLAKGCRIEK